MLPRVLISATKMTGRPGPWSEPGEYNILFLGSMLIISSQDSPDLGILVDVSDFLFFSAWEGGRRSPRRREGGGRFN